MKRILSFALALGFLSATFAACTMDFNQFTPSGGGGTGAAGGSGGSACNGGCCTALDCPAPSDPCQRATCLANTCGEEPRPDGTAVDMQTDGDCKKAVCNGGAVGSEDDDADVFDDGNDCTTDTCAAGTPGSMPKVAGDPCASNGGKICDGLGACVDCLSDNDCGQDTCDLATHNCIPATCMDGEQNGDETDTDCGGMDCNPCDVGDDCNEGTDCVTGVCGGNGKCAPASCGDGVKNGDETDVDCGDACPNQCGPGQGCNQDNDCEGDDCSGVGGTCVPNCNDGVKNNNESDIDCGGGTCNGCGIGDDCANVDANCISGNCGAGDVCEGSPIGTACGNDNECLSGNCTDDVCCMSPCQGFCRSCVLPGSIGTCQDIPEGQDPNNECGGPAVCDGGGGCAKADGQTCANSGECLTGHPCVDGVCCATACGGTCEACNVAGSAGTCTKIPNGQDPANECMGVCDGAGACVKGGLGTTCSAPGDCVSDFCTDGVCCGDTCTGLCKACNVMGSAGTCTNIPNGQDPANECPGANQCNGAGACQ